MELCCHHKPRRLVVPPPSCEAISVTFLGLLFCDCLCNCAIPRVHKHASDATWAAVQILVATPSRGIDVPVMKRQRNIADSVCQIPDDEDPVFVSVRRDGRDVQQLARVVLYSREEYERRILRMFRDEGLDVIGAENVVCGERRFDKHHGGVCGQAMVSDLCLYGEMITRESLALKYDLVPAVWVRVVERREQEMQVACECLHYSDL